MRRLRAALLFAPAAIALGVGIYRSRLAWNDAAGYLDAGEAVLRGTFSNAVTNNWPPFFSLIAIPISWLSALPPLWGRVLWALITSGGFALALRKWWQEARPPGNPDWIAPVAVLTMTGFWLHHIHYQQVYGLVFAATALGFVEAQRRHDVRAGIFIGLAASAKVTPAFTLFYFLFARRFRVVATAVVVAIVCSLSTALALGPRGAVEAHRTFLSRAASLRGTHGTQNQSVVALVERLTTGETVPERGGLPPLVRLSHPIADGIGKALSALLVTGVGFLLARRREDPIHAFAPLVGAAVLAGSYCWRNQLIAFLPLVLFTFARLARGVHGRASLLAVPFLAGIALREPAVVGEKIFYFFEGGLGLTCIAFLCLIALHLDPDRNKVEPWEPMIWHEKNKQS